jgi:hypothetical protein
MLLSAHHFRCNRIPSAAWTSMSVRLGARRLFSLAGLPLRISNAHTINPASKIGVIDLGPGVVCFTCALSVYTLQSLREPVNRALLRIADHIEA